MATLNDFYTSTGIEIQDEGITVGTNITKLKFAEGVDILSNGSSANVVLEDTFLGLRLVPEELRTDLISYWDFDVNAQIQLNPSFFLQGDSYTLTDGVRGDAIIPTDYPYASNLALNPALFASGFTIVCLVKPFISAENVETDVEQPLISIGGWKTETTDYRQVRLLRTAELVNEVKRDKLIFSIYHNNTTVSEITAITDLPTTGFSYIAVTWSKVSRAMSIYVNGVGVASGLSTTNTIRNTGFGGEFMVGCSNKDMGNTLGVTQRRNQFPGAIDTVSYWASSLSSIEIKKFYEWAVSGTNNFRTYTHTNSFSCVPNSMNIVKPGTGAINATLPNLALIGDLVTFCDGSGVSETTGFGLHNLIIYPAGTHTIAGASQLILDKGQSSVTLKFDGSSKWLILNRSGGQGEVIGGGGDSGDATKVYIGAYRGVVSTVTRISFSVGDLEMDFIIGTSQRV